MSTMNKELASLYEIRDYDAAGDEAFVMATFLRGLYYGNEFFSIIPKDLFMDNYKLVIGALLSKNQVKVACLREDPSVILGYSIISNDFKTLHWVFLKKAWRLQGIGRSLVPKYITSVSHFTSMGLPLLKKFDNCVFDPFKLT